MDGSIKVEETPANASTGMPRRALRNIGLLGICQALTQGSNTLMFASSALAVLTIIPADMRVWANLPVTMQHLGVMLSVFPASMLMMRRGRKLGFRLGSLFGMAGASCAAVGLQLGSFPVMCLGGLLLGYAVANMQLYRFAAVELAPLSFRAKAISYVTAGGVIAGIIGPTLARWTPDLWQPLFQASFVSVIVIHSIVFVVLGFIEFPVVKAEDATRPAAAAARDRDAARLYGRGGRGDDRFRGDVVRDGRFTVGHRAVRPQQDRGADHHLRACHGHVPAGFLHRPPDPALRHLQHHDRRHRAADRRRGRRPAGHERMALPRSARA